jgi:hypothetical protein
MMGSRTATRSEYRWERQRRSRERSPRTRKQGSPRPSERVRSAEQDFGREPIVSGLTFGGPSEIISVTRAPNFALDRS